MSLDILSKGPLGGRRSFMGTAAASAAGMAAMAGMLRPGTAHAATVTDADILNFALNLEYLEAEYYVRGVTGQGLTAADTQGGTGTYGGVVSVPKTAKVTFTSHITEAFANELAADELAHVQFLRAQLGSAKVNEPEIDIGTAFNTLAMAAGFGSSFDPYESEINFLIGGFVFEDVGVTAYHGAAALISNSDYLTAAAGILGTEAYHAGALRAYLITAASTYPNAGIGKIANSISNLRDKLDGKKMDDQGINYMGAPNNVPVDANSITFARTTSQVLSIVYGGMPNGGVFFPTKMNGTIS